MLRNRHFVPPENLAGYFMFAYLHKNVLIKEPEMGQNVLKKY